MRINTQRTYCPNGVHRHTIVVQLYRCRVACGSCLCQLVVVVFLHSIGQLAQTILVTGNVGIHRQERTLLDVLQDGVRSPDIEPPVHHLTHILAHGGKTVGGRQRQTDQRILRHGTVNVERQRETAFDVHVDTHVVVHLLLPFQVVVLHALQFRTQIVSVRMVQQVFVGCHGSVGILALATRIPYGTAQFQVIENLIVDKILLVDIPAHSRAPEVTPPVLASELRRRACPQRTVQQVLVVVRIVQYRQETDIADRRFLSVRLGFFQVLFSENQVVHTVVRETFRLVDDFLVGLV